MKANTAKPLELGAYPVLKRLGLSIEHLEALKSQGYVSCEKRGGKIVERLRYRFEGRQHARYVRRDEAAALRAELDLWQRRVRARQRLRRAVALARQALCERKTLRTPLYAERGYHFHGHEVRRCRRSKGLRVF